MKAIQRFFLVFGIILVLAIGALVAAPFLFKGQILSFIQTKANEQLNADLSFDDVSLSLLKNFPNFTVSIDDVSLINHAPFDSVTFAKAKSISATVDLKSVLDENIPYKLKALTLDEPVINIKVLEDGTANWDIAKESSDTEEVGENTASESSDFKLEVNSFEIKEGTIVYDDIPNDIYVEAKEVNQISSGDIASTIYDLTTELTASSFTVTQGDISYLTHADTELDLKINIDTDNSKYTLKENSLKLNSLVLNTEGYVALPNDDDIELDLQFNSPSSDFKDILSMIPHAYTKDYSSVKTTGKMGLKGLVKGIYNAKSYPAFDVDLTAANASFKYPDLPATVNNINSHINVTSPQTKNLDDMKIDISKLHFDLKNEPFDATLFLTHVMSDPYVKGNINGIINLDNWSQAFPMEDIQKLSGIIDADVNMEAKMSQIDNEEYEKVNVNGKVNIKELVYQGEGQPETFIKNADAVFSPKYVEVSNFDAKMGKSDVKAAGRVDNLLAYFSPKQSMTGTLNLKSNYFDANEWISEETEAPKQEDGNIPAHHPTTEEDNHDFDRYEFDIDADFKRLLYEDYDLRNSRLKGTVSPQAAKFKEFYTELGSTDLLASGEIHNIDGYLNREEILTGDINFKSDNLDMDELMGVETNTALSENTTKKEDNSDSQAYIVPSNMDFKINTDIKKVKYDDIDLTNVSGAIGVNEGIASLDNVKANALGGSFKIDGTYNTLNPEKPLFDLDYDMNRIDFEKAFSQFNSFKAIAPIGQFISGKLTTNFNMSGVLQQNMYPDLNSINADGIFEAINAVVKEFKPLNGLANSLDVINLEKLQLKDVASAFSIKDGAFTLQEPIAFSHSDIAMNFSGSHSLNNEMDYLLKLKIPREKIDQSVAGGALNAGESVLKGQAEKLGISIDESEFVNVDVTFFGSVLSPKFKTKLVNAEGKNLKDAIKEKAIDEVKKKLGVEEKIETVQDAAKEKTQEVVKETKEKVQEQVKKETDKVKEQVKEKVKEETKEKLDDLLKDKFKDINPFKKNN